MPDSVLLAVGDAALRRASGDHLERIGYQVERSASGAAAIEAFERSRPDVVILDRHLPDAGGVELLERLRARDGSVILLTGPGDGDTAVRAMQLGAEHVLTQPVDLDFLAAATARVCEKVRLARQNALLREALDRLPPVQPGERGEEGGPGGDGRHQPQALVEVERAHIEKTLRFHGGNRTRAAQALGISRATLINKIRIYGL